MDLLKMIAELEAERTRLDHAIVALERLSAGKARRRGRPPSWLKDETERVTQEQEESAPDASRRRRTKPDNE